MGIHMVALAKLNHLFFASRSSSPTGVAYLVWPYLLRLSVSCERIWHGYSDAVYASRLFFFQLRRIALPGGDDRDHAGDMRWERALRLICRRLISGRQSTVTLVDEESFHTLSMLAL